MGYPKRERSSRLRWRSRLSSMPTQEPSFRHRRSRTCLRGLRSWLDLSNSRVCSRTEDLHVPLYVRRRRIVREELAGTLWGMAGQPRTMPWTEYAVNNNNCEEVAIYLGLIWRLTEGLIPFGRRVITGTRLCTPQELRTRWLGGVRGCGSGVANWGEVEDLCVIVRGGLPRRQLSGSKST